MSHSIRRSQVKSSSLATVGFSPEHNVLQIEFRNGLVYEYFGVTHAIYEQVLASDSKGVFLHRYGRGCFPFPWVESRQQVKLTQ